MTNELIWDKELIKRYDTAGPRYTSYPTAVQFTEDLGPDAYIEAAARSRDKNSPLSLYIHIPFCSTICYYCACNKIITKRREQAEPYLQHLYKEIEMQSRLFSRDQVVEQLHFGGGTPTFLSPEQMQNLMDHIGKHFSLADGRSSDFSIEIDPREADWGTICHLRDLGFNRISLGVQDFDIKVQKAINRIQSQEMTQSILDAARTMCFRSINMDLIYGLPHQNCESFLKTVDTVIEMRPDRISVFNYAHLPERFKPQRRINEADLPSPEEKLKILEQTTTRLQQAGYVYIGMDHFALPDDELAMAQENGTLHRNFQGYTTHSHCDLIGLGVSSIGKVDGCYVQNPVRMEPYMEAIDGDRLAYYRGLQMTDDDHLRQQVINELICHFKLDISGIESSFLIDFYAYFADTIPALEQMQADGLLTFSNNKISVLPAGRLLIRNICMLFDAHLNKKTHKNRYSRVI
ncbi:oxygen-independent coproporphyrinogen III oxidase [Spongorhabdus nitratireducens]